MRKFLATMTCAALLSLGLAGLSGCSGNGGTSGNVDSSIIAFSEGDSVDVFVGKTYTSRVTLKDGLSASSVSFSSNIGKSDGKIQQAGSTVQYAIKTEGTYKIVATIEYESVKYTSTLVINATHSENETYVFSAQFGDSAKESYKQGEVFSSDGISIYKSLSVDGEVSHLVDEQATVGTYKFVIEQDGSEVELKDGDQLIEANDSLKVTIKSLTDGIGDGEFTLSILPNPVYKISEFFQGLGTNFSTWVYEEGDTADETGWTPIELVTDTYLLDFYYGNAYIKNVKDEYIYQADITYPEGLTSVSYDDLVPSPKGKLVNSDTAHTETKDWYATDIAEAYKYVGIKTGDDFNETVLTGGSEYTEVSNGTQISYVVYDANSDAARFIMSVTGYGSVFDNYYDLEQIGVAVQEGTDGALSLIIDAAYTYTNSLNVSVTGDTVFMVSDVGNVSLAGFESAYEAGFDSVKYSDDVLTSAVNVIKGSNFTGSYNVSYWTFTTKATEGALDFNFKLDYTGYDQDWNMGVYQDAEGKKHSYSKDAADDEADVSDLSDADYETYLASNWAGFGNLSILSDSYDIEGIDLRNYETSYYQKDTDGIYYGYHVFRLNSASLAYLFMCQTCLASSSTTNECFLYYLLEENMNLAGLRMIVGTTVSNYKEENQSESIYALYIGIYGEYFYDAASNGSYDAYHTIGNVNIVNFVVDMSTVGSTTNEIVDELLASEAEEASL